MGKTAIVIGATGLVGSHLLDYLAAAEHVTRIVALTRRVAKHESSKVHYHVIDFDRLEESVDLFHGDFLFSCLGTTKAKAKTYAAQRKVDLDYQLAVAQLAADQGVDHFLLVSSSGANARSVSPYLKMKGELETSVQSLGFNNLSIFKPSLLLGDRGESRIAEDLAAKLMPIACKLPGLKKYRPIAAKDVACKMCEVSQKTESDGLVYYRLDQLFTVS